MIRLFKSALARTVSLGLAVMVALGVLLGAVHLALPFADVFRSQLESRLSETLGLRAEVEHFGLGLTGFVPRLSLVGAKLVDPKTGHIQLSLDQLQIDLDLAATLRARAPQIDAVTLVGAHLVVKQTDDGFTVAGLEGIQGGDPAAMTFFLGNGRFLLSRSDIQLIAARSESPVLWLTSVRMRLENAGGRHRLGLRGEVFGEPGSSLRLAGDLRGSPGDPSGWKGAMYLHWKGEDLGRIGQRLLPAGWHLRSTGLDIESWSDWSGGALRDVLGRIRLAGLEASRGSLGETASTPRIDEVSGLVRWRSVDTGWRVDATSLTLVRDGVPRPPADLSVRVEPEDDGWNLSAGISALRIADGRDLIGLVPGTEPRLMRWLAAARPEGTLRDLSLRMAAHGAGASRWAATGGVFDLGFEPYERAPGLRGVTAHFYADESGGSAAVHSAGLTFSLPHLFREPIRADRVEGRLRWRRDVDGGWRIEAPEVIADNADIATRSRLAAAFPADGGSPLLDLQVDFRDGDVAAIRRYLPVGELKPGLVRWLDAAFVSGRVPSGTFLLRGTPADFPFRGNEGRMEVVFGVEDGILDYQTDWPRLEEIVGEVMFENQRFEASVSDARFLESEVSSTRAHITDLFHPVSVQVRGSVRGPFADGLRTLQETPLKAKLGALAGSFRAAGASRIDLEMAIPLGSAVPLTLKGQLAWSGTASLAIPDWDLTLSDLGGSLSFTEQAVSADDLSASLWNVPVRIRIDSPREVEAGTDVTRIRVRAPLTTRLLAQHFASPLWDLTRGQTSWDLTLGINNTDLAQVPLPLNFTLSSGLEGVAVSLPAPLGKTAPERRALRVAGRLARGEGLRVQGAYGELGFNLAFDRDAANSLVFARGAVDLSGQIKSLPQGDGVDLSGTLATLDLGAWLNWWAGQAEGGTATSSRGAALRGADVRIARVQLADLACHALQLKLRRGSGRWEARIDGADVAGSVWVPDRPRNAPVRVRLERLDLKSSLSENSGAGESLKGDATGVDPRKAGTLDLRVDRLLWGSNVLGTTAVRVEPRTDGLAFAELSLKGPLMTIAGSGSWTRDGTRDRTAVSLNATGKDLGGFLRDLDLDSVLYKAPTKASLSLEWPGGPFQLDLTSLHGRLEAEVGAGSLLDVEPGLGRVFGVLNLGALRRRLALDFSDIFERGYGFETIKGAMTFRDGKAVIDRLAIKGPSASIDVAGSADLSDQTFDQVVTVTPRIGPGVVVASAVAGGPLVGAAVYLADRVSDGAVDRLASYQYRITGPWNAPDIRRAGGAGGDATKSMLAPTEPGGAANRPPPEDSHPRKRKAPENLFLEGH
ncbi:MAG: YhdP family protein [Chromatiaceae bacterium]